ncbi:N-acetylglucosamine/diacetylchitobiose ABC transporter substrate-binding protein [Streptomyces thermolineatus]|uniref:N-acetylglucosamine/diacetylchitobiose ABC transporter substrate-binding protein n=1 Tax=Streptomyces thermolineatus TaxID=44033 RepID=A0ABP5ZK06_9ACTN
MGSTSATNGFGRRDLIRRAAAIGLAAVPASGLLSACASGGSDGEKAEKGTRSAKNPLAVNEKAPLDVVIFDGGFGDQYAKDAEKLYAAAFPGAEIKHKATQEIQPLLQPRFVAGNPPDLIDNSGAKLMDVASLAAKGQLADLNTLLDAPSYDDPSVKVRDTLVPSTIEIGKFGGEEVYTLNYAFTVYGLWHSKKLLEDNDWEYPRTWDAMMSLCAKAKKKGIAGWTYAGKHPYYIPFAFYPFIAKAGGMQVFADIANLEPNAWKHDAVKDAFEAYHELAAKGYVLKGTPGLDHIQSQTEWTKGKALFIPNGSWVENEAKKTTPADFAMTVAPPPSLGSSDAMPFETVWASPGEPFIVPEQARNAAGGMELLRIMLSRKSAQNFAKLVSSLTSVKGAVDGMELPSGLASANAVLNAAGDNVLVPRIDEWYKEFHREQVGGALAELMAGRIRPAEAIARIQKDADALAKDDSVKKYEFTV